jgi:acetyltransferase
MSKLDGYELILGSSIDPQFGPVLLFGMGGTLVEVFKDRALGLPPLNSTLARRMMERTTIYTALKGVRGRKPVDLAALESVLVRFSQLIVEQRWIKELDINPLLAPEVKESELPRLAIRPYPRQYESVMTTRSGETITIRPIRAEDEPALVKFHGTLSDRSVYMRYMSPLLFSERVAHERLARIAHCDYDREISLVVVRGDADGCDCEILGLGRLSKLHGLDRARFSLLICDQCQGQGIGNVLLERLVDLARHEKVGTLEAIMTPDNQAMRLMCERLGFKVAPTEDGKMLRAELELN